MALVISKCGNYCGTCPWGCYKRARLADDEWEDYRDAAKKYVGYTPTIKPCQACQTPDEKLSKDVGVHNFVRGCLARKCAIHNGVENCAYCSRYPCDWIEAHIGEISREKVEERIGEQVPDEAYESFIEPFQGKAHLDLIRAKLGEDDIVEAKPVELAVKKFIDFPKGAKLNGVNTSALRNAYEVLSELANTSFGLKHPDTMACAGIIKSRRDVIFRLLWTMIGIGNLRAGGRRIVMDGVTYAANKKGTDPLTTLSRAEIYIGMLRNFGIHAELVQLHDDWTTESGYLRTHIPKTNKPAWEFIMSFSEDAGGAPTLKALKAYVEKLVNDFDKRAFTRFSKGDMRFLAV
ncbi:MAG: DUF3795 domain-containing protein [Candidatus Thorarchaeota archaeon]